MSDSDWERETDTATTATAAAKPPRKAPATSAWTTPSAWTAASHPSAGPSFTAQRPQPGDDEWFRGGNGNQGNRQIWDSANRTSSSPMASQAPAPPKLHILKRPSAPKAEQPRSGSATPKSMTQREEEYRLARERIFGAGDEGNKGRERQGRRSGTSTPSSRSGRSSPARGDELARDVERLAIRPQRSQHEAVGRSSSNSSSPAGPVPALRGGVSPGVLRQPRGPGGGGGFGGSGGERSERSERSRT